MAFDIVADEYLEVNDVPLATPAFIAATLAALNDDAPIRGTSLLLPGATGRRGRRRRRDESVRVIPLHIFGRYDHDGDPHTVWEQGLIDNYEYLKDNLGIASTSGNGTVEAVWHHPDMGTRVAYCYPELVGFTKVSPFQAKATLDLTIPAGVFVLSGS